MSVARRIVVTGGTGYMGCRLIPALLDSGHDVTAVVRAGSLSRLPAACRKVTADVLDGGSYRGEISPGDVFVHLVGVPHPSPSKARQFVEVDRKSAMEAIRVARDSGVRQFVYVSVAHPAPVMKAYADVRISCEAAIVEAKLNATILRPWYVLGPGHYWPYTLQPLYWLAERIPSTAEGARRLGLITIRQMIRALVFAVENPADGVTVFDVPRIRAV